SYREMTEWALPVPKLTAYIRLVHDIEHDPRGPEFKRFFRGGYWRNFKVKYPETQEMYGRMLQVSRRLQEANSRRSKLDIELEPNVVTSAGATELTARIDQARTELYRAQCNCAWWHGAFGGLYLPHLRNAVYQHLIAAENALLEEEGRGDD